MTGRIDRVAFTGDGPHLDHDSLPMVDSDQVDLAPAHVDVAGHDLEPVISEESGGDRLA
jgi:hypothetical protein